MNKEKRIYLLAQFDMESNQKLRAIYDKLQAAGFLGTQTKEIPYHITLLDVVLAEKQEVLRRAEAVAEAEKAFTVSLNHIGLFGQNVLFLAPAANAQLMQMHAAFAGSKQNEKEKGFTPHTTLLIDTPAHINEAAGIVMKTFKPFTVKIDSIGVYAFFPKELIGEYSLAE